MADLKTMMQPKRPEMLKFVEKSAPWTEYELENGSLVRVRNVLVRAIWDGTYLENGLPKIEMNFQQLVDYVPTDAEKELAEARVKSQEKK